MNETPIPHDLGLQLPLPEGLVKLLLVLLFLVHILFVNFMMGGVTLSLLFEMVGLSRKKYDRLAREVTNTITVNKSLAVVLGVAPLLTINLAYTTYFYSANALTGFAWMMIIPAVTLAFLLTYLHKYSWDRWSQGYKKAMHVAVQCMALVMFLSVALIFITNVNLMVLPYYWPHTHGFISAVLLPNALARYLHFVTAAIAVSSLFAVGWFGRKTYKIEERIPGFYRQDIKRIFYLIAFIATFVQLAIFGPLLLLSMPVYGLSFSLYLIIAVGIVAALVFMVVIWFEMKSERTPLNRHFGLVIFLLTVTVLAMAFGRHVYRERAVLPHRMAMMAKTEAFYWESKAAETRVRMGISKATFISEGEKDFKANCSACHAADKVLVGPSLQELNDIYKDDVAGLVKWTIAPVVKRGGVPMPSFKHLGEDRLTVIAKYILDAE